LADTRADLTDVERQTCHVRLAQRQCGGIWHNDPHKHRDDSIGCAD
jgi:hypothetical protein